MLIDKEKFPRGANILLIKLRSIGDVVYNTAVYTPLKRCYPDSRLTVLVEPASYDLVCDHPDVDEVLCFKKGSCLEQARFYLRLFRNRYDIAIDMHEGTRGAVMCFVTRAPYRVGHKYARRSFLYNVKVDFNDLNPKYPIDYQVGLIQKLGGRFDRPAPDIHISTAHRENAERLLAENGIGPNDEFCLLHVGTRKIYDQWQYEKFARLTEMFSDRFGLKVILTCGPGEEDQVQKVIGRLSPGTPFVFLTTGLQELGVITRRARFALCHNGGYMHLASAMGTPVIALFGVVHPRVWRPLGDRHVILYKNIECSPCNSRTRKKECYQGDAECKRQITVEDVLEGADRILLENPKPRM